jgi:Chaperone of endosialidase
LTASIKANVDGSAAIQVGGVDAITLTSAGAASFVTSPMTIQGGSAAAPSLTFSGDTNTGIFSPAADTIAIGTGGTERLRVDSAGNAGLGVTPATWSTPAFNFGGSAIGSLSVIGTTTSLGNNINYNSGYKYTTSAAAGLYQISNNVHYWFQAASGTAGNAITFTQAMTLDASGNLLVNGTSTYNPISNNQILVSSANTPMLVMDNSSVSVGKEVGRIIFGGALANNRYSSISGFCPSTAPGIDVYDLRFNTMNGGSSGPTERVRIAADGKVGIGGQTENAVKLQIIGEGNTNSTFSIYCRDSGNTGRFAAGNGGTVYATSTTISSISDQRLKENIADLDVGLDAVMALKPRKFDWKEGQGKNITNDRGFIAQEFEQVFPDLIDEWIEPAPEGEEPYKSVRQDLIPVLVKALQELKAELDATKAEVALLKGAA